MRFREDVVAFEDEKPRGSRPGGPDSSAGLPKPERIDYCCLPGVTSSGHPALRHFHHPLGSEDDDCKALSTFSRMIWRIGNL